VDKLSGFEEDRGVEVEVRKGKEGKRRGIHYRLYRRLRHAWCCIGKSIKQIGIEKCKETATRRYLKRGPAGSGGVGTTEGESGE